MKSSGFLYRDGRRRADRWPGVTPITPVYIKTVRITVGIHKDDEYLTTYFLYPVLKKAQDKAELFQDVLRSFKREYGDKRVALAGYGGRAVMVEGKELLDGIERIEIGGVVRDVGGWRRCSLECPTG